MRLLNDILAKNVKANPGKAALRHGGRAVSYAELAAEAARVAGALEAMHGTTGNTVGLLLRNSPEFLFAYFGAAASGNVAVPINYHLQADEVAFVLKNSGCSVLFTSEEFLPKVRAAARQVPTLRAVVCAGGSAHPGVRSWESFVQGQPGVYAPPASARPEDVAVFLYTSGTTGFPKGAMCTHAGLLSNVVTEAELYGLGSEDVFACVLPLSHNYSLVDTCLLPLWYGATIILGDHTETEGLLQLIE